VRDDHRIESRRIEAGGRQIGLKLADLAFCRSISASPVAGVDSTSLEPVLMTIDCTD